MAGRGEVVHRAVRGPLSGPVGPSAPTWLADCGGDVGRTPRTYLYRSTPPLGGLRHFGRYCPSCFPKEDRNV